MFAEATGLVKSEGSTSCCDLSPRVCQIRGLVAVIVAPMECLEYGSATSKKSCILQN